jgi:ABC-2 type transport system permease protein
MKQFTAFVRKEFFHVLRDRRTLLILFGMPIAQILIFGFALTNEVKDSEILVVDYAKDDASQRIITEIAASRYFNIRNAALTHKEILSTFQKGKIKAVVVFPSNFNRDLLHNNQAQIQIITDATDINTANMITNYLTAIIKDYQTKINENLSIPYQITAETRMLYNPQLKGAHGFVPGVMALVLMLVSVMMTAISIVREKETGTMEILLVSPFKPVLVIFAKAFPYLILSLINVSAILFLSVFALELPVKGSLLLLFAESTLFIITCLALGIFISIKTDSQQIAMLICLMGMLLPTMMFSGFLFPIENMPVPLQVISNIIPSKWFYIIVKSIMIKGLGISALWKETLILAGMTLFLLTISLTIFKNSFKRVNIEFY